jgi:dephospho-CoA kinase
VDGAADRARTPLSIGLTGPNAAGKSAVVEHLVGRGFARHSLSDVVRQEAARRGLDPSRANLIEVGNDLRRREGPAALAARIRPRLGPRNVIDSIRNPAEVAELRRLDGFRLLGVDAPLPLRFERARRRGRLGDGDTLEEFRRREQIENGAEPTAQQLGATLALADAVVTNDGTLEDLLRQVDHWVGDWSPPSSP